MKFYYPLLFALLLSCHNVKEKSITIHGHRGCRGLWPENTIKGFQEALALGINTLELDVVVSKDHRIMVSHDPFMHHEICFKPDSTEIAEDESTQLNIYKMTADEVQHYWVGLKQHPRFAEQQTFASHIPTLKDVVFWMEAYKAAVVKDGKPITWNVEIKSKPEWDNIYHPEPKEYVEIFLKHFNGLQNPDNYIIQSFDARILEELYKQAPQLKLVYLNEEAKDPATKLKEISFKPYGYSPNYRLVDEETVWYCEVEGITLITWTVNEVQEMQRLMEMGVSQIITDYPDRAIALLQQE